MSENITLGLSDDEIEAIRARAAELAEKEANNDRWGRTAELNKTRERIKGDTAASVAYLLKYLIRDDSPEVNEYGEPI